MNDNKELKDILTKLADGQGKTNRMLTWLFAIIAATCLLFIAACMVTPADDTSSNAQIIVCTDEQLQKILEVEKE